MKKHWSKVEYLHETVKNPNIIIKGKKSYYSDAWTGTFEESVVRYLSGDEYSLKSWEPMWEIDKLYIGNYACIGAVIATAAVVTKDVSPYTVVGGNPAKGN